MKKTVYISGQITGHRFYRVYFAIAEIKLRLQGYNVVNPAKVCAKLPRGLLHEQYMSICIPMLKLCDYIYVIGTKISKGMEIELSKARINAIRVID